MSFGQSFPSGDMFQNIQEQLKGAVSGALQGANVGTAQGEVKLTVTTDISGLQQQFTDSLGRLAGGGRPFEASFSRESGASGKIETLLEKLAKSIDGLASASRGGAPGDPLPVPDGEPGPVAPGTTDAPGRSPRWVHAWQLQQFTNDPIGAAKYYFMDSIFSQAVKVARMPIGQAMGTIGVGTTGALGALALYGGWQAGDWLRHLGVDDAVAQNMTRLQDNNLWANTGYDLRGHTYDPARWDQNSRVFWDLRDTRTVLGAMNVNLGTGPGGWVGDKNFGNFSGQSGFDLAEKAAHASLVARNQFGVNEDAMGAMIGEAMKSGLISKTTQGIDSLLERIAAATEEGAKNGLSSKDSFHALTALLQLQDSRGGAVTSFSANALQGMWEKLQSTGSPTLRGGKGTDFINQLGTNNTDGFRGYAMSRLMNGSELSEFGARAAADLGIQGASPQEVAMALLEDPGTMVALKAQYAQEYGGMMTRTNLAHNLGLKVNAQSLVGMDSLVNGKGIWDQPFQGAVRTPWHGSTGADASINRDIAGAEQIRILSDSNKDLTKSAQTLNHTITTLNEDLRSGIWWREIKRELLGNTGKVNDDPYQREENRGLDMR